VLLIPRFFELLEYLIVVFNKVANKDLAQVKILLYLGLKIE